MSDVNEKPRTVKVAYLLWLFLGAFGAHRFYMGRKRSGFGMLGLNVGSFVLSVFGIGLIGFLGLFVWWAVDAYLLNKWLKEGTPTVAGAALPVSTTSSESPSQAA